MSTGDPLEEFRPDIPSPARMYNYYLGGKDHFPADREAAERVIAMMPEGMVRASARQNRQFLRRAVRYMAAEAGIRQFLDIGAGLPTMGSVHQVAQTIAPECRIVYVDNDPVVVAHGRDMLRGVEQSTIVGRDLRDVDELLADQELHRTIDLSRPVGVLLVAILNFITDQEDAYGIVGRLRGVMAPGSHLVVSHAESRPAFAATAKVYDQATAGLTLRTVAEVGRFFEGFEILPPGLVPVSQWRPDIPPLDKDIPVIAGVGRKPW